MKETRILKVIGVQNDEHGSENKIELLTEGTYYEKNNSLYIVYEESEISGMGGTTTTLKIEGNKKVSLKRFGNSSVRFVFEEGKPFEADYNTIFGNFKMELFTNNLEIDLCKATKTGSIKIQYHLNVIGLSETDNRLKIELSKLKA